MHPYEKKINRLYFYWLFLSLILIFLIIIVGGLTRLTNSGLSITEWELFKGILPPLNDLSWKSYFAEYKKIPQYKLLNNNMSLDEFKVIFYWEYFHRVLARLVGLFFLIPLIYFYLSKKIKNDYMNICYIIFVLIVLQGIIGWYMVVSGLTKDVTVSHYRLSIHLVNAILIISMLFWLIKNISTQKNKIFFNFSIINLPFQILIFLIVIQIIIGAFVSGLDAGRIYQTWPLMGNNYFPDDFSFINLNNFFDFNNHSLIQFYHRNLAYFIIFYVVILSISIFKNREYNLYKPLKILLFFLSLQVFLGIYTLLSELNIFLASLHQIVSVLLIFSALNLYFFKVK